MIYCSILQWPIFLFLKLVILPQSKSITSKHHPYHVYDFKINFFNGIQGLGVKSKTYEGFLSIKTSKELNWVVQFLAFLRENSFYDKDKSHCFGLFSHQLQNRFLKLWFTTFLSLFFRMLSIAKIQLSSLIP